MIAFMQSEAIRPYRLLLDLVRDLNAQGQQTPCQADTEGLWFGDDKHQVARAVERCQACPVLAECLDYAQAQREQYGVWGGRNFNRIAQKKHQARKEAA